MILISCQVLNSPPAVAQVVHLHLYLEILVYYFLHTILLEAPELHMHCRISPSPSNIKSLPSAINPSLFVLIIVATSSGSNFTNLDFLVTWLMLSASLAKLLSPNDFKLNVNHFSSEEDSDLEEL